MLETIRAYAAQRLADAGEVEDFETAHARYFADLAATAAPLLHGPGQLEWLDRLRAEHANLHTAIRYALAHADAATALRLVASLGWYWWLIGDRTEGRRLTAQALDAADPAPGPERAAALTYRAMLGMFDEPAAGAEDTLDEAVRCYRAAGDERGAGLPTALLAVVARGRGDAGRTRVLLDRAGTAGGWAGAVARWLAGTAGIVDGDPARAEDDLGAALASFADLGDRWGRSQVLASLGMVAEIRGRYPAALAMLDEAVELTRRLGNDELTAALLANTGNVRTLTGAYAAAASCHDEALRLAQRLGLRAVEAFTRNGIGLAARRQGDLDRARGNHERALEFYRRIGSASGTAYTLACLGYVAELGGDADRAEADHLDGLAAARRAGDPRAVALALEGLAGVAALRGDGGRCAVLLGAAAALRTGAGAPTPTVPRRLVVATPGPPSSTRRSGRAPR
jgi:tetratricopeptide (TPR) repeat protein